MDQISSISVAHNPASLTYGLSKKQHLSDFGRCHTAIEGEGMIKARSSPTNTSDWRILTSTNRMMLLLQFQ